MVTLLLSIPVAVFIAARSKLWRVLRGLPSQNEDFIHF